MAAPLVEVTNATVDALASRPDVAAALPHLFSGLAEAKQVAAGGCSRCNKERLARVYDRIKLAIVHLGPPHLRQLKGFLDAERIRVEAGLNHQRQKVRHTL